MLEGKEFEKDLGEYGKAYADVGVSDMGVITVDIGVQAKVDIVAELKKMAAKTATPIDDQAILWIEGVIKAAKPA